MDQTPRSNLTDREMLLLLADQNRRMEQTIDRLVSSIESRLAQGDRRFADLDTRMINSDQRHTATNSAINTLSGRVIDLERALNGERGAARSTEDELKAQIKAVEQKLEAQADEFATWKTRAQTVGAVLGFVWAFVTFIWPLLPTLILIINGGGGA